MRLLAITQKVDRNDENLGAFYRWWEKLAPHADAFTILCREAGDAELPSHVKIAVFGTGERGTRGRFGRFVKFMKLFARHYRESDAILFHQIPEFVLAAAPFLKTMPRRSILWYAHGVVSWKLKVAERLVTTVITSSANGFRLPSKKVIYTGQAIDTDAFCPDKRESFREGSGMRIITVGRISPVKDYETMLKALEILEKKEPGRWMLSIAGGPMTAHDEKYYLLLRKYVADAGLARAVQFLGPRPYREIPAFLNEHDFFLNLSATGSLDKAVLEAMACGRTVLTANEAYRDILPPRYFLEHTSPEFVAGRLGALAGDPRPNEILRRIVTERHSLDRMITQLVPLLGEGSRR